jgi:hypothetical protein
MALSHKICLFMWSWLESSLHRLSPNADLDLGMIIQGLGKNRIAQRAPFPAIKP